MLKDYDKIPQDLKNLDQWVLANRHEKQPYDVFGLPASVSDPRTWRSFPKCWRAVEDGNADYAGFVFHDNGIVGIDIDAGFEDKIPTALCIDIMSACRSYTEVSRSGRGVHILVRGDIPFAGRNNRSGVEIYKTGRYFIMTGDVLIFDTIIDNQAALDYVVDRYFPDISTDKKGMTRKLYTPTWKAPKNGKLQVRPDYSPLGPGERNDCLTSLAGAMWNTGYTKEQILNELRRANQKACRPALPDSELRGICRSISRYRR